MRALVILFLVGCQSGTFDYRPGQHEAELIVWRGVYGMKDDPPPVEWIENDGWDYGGQDDYGITLIGWKVQVACGEPRFPWPIQVTKYAHELLHWKCWLDTGDVDVAHSHCDWSLEEKANKGIVSLALLQ